LELTTYLQFFLALILVIGLILGLAWIMKRTGFGGGASGPLARRRRLSTVEAAALDARHRVVLIRRDNVEHLVLIGPNTSQVIETGIPSTTPNDPLAMTAAPFTAFSQFLKKDKQP
jgi:flagellar protein FliO/FliZ